VLSSSVLITPEVFTRESPKFPAKLPAACKQSPPKSPAPHRKPQRRPQTLDKPPHHVMLLRLGEQFVPASYPANLDPALFRRVTRHQLIQRSLHRQLLFPEGFRQLLIVAGSSAA